MLRPEEDRSMAGRAQTSRGVNHVVLNSEPNGHGIEVL
jgi:hypothetical protein